MARFIEAQYYGDVDFLSVSDTDPGLAGEFWSTGDTNEAGTTDSGASTANAIIGWGAVPVLAAGNETGGASPPVGYIGYKKRHRR